MHPKVIDIVAKDGHGEGLRSHPCSSFPFDHRGLERIDAEPCQVQCRRPQNRSCFTLLALTPKSKGPGSPDSIADPAMPRTGAKSAARHQLISVAKTAGRTSRSTIGSSPEIETFWSDYGRQPDMTGLIVARSCAT
jgi:hypothetical protein